MLTAPDRLTPAELEKITGKARAASQAAALARLGVPYTFTGRALLVDRTVAVAHSLLTAPERRGINMAAIR